MITKLRTKAQIKQEITAITADCHTTLESWAAQDLLPQKGAEYLIEMQGKLTAMHTSLQFSLNSDSVLTIKFEVARLVSEREVNRRCLVEARAGGTNIDELETKEHKLRGQLWGFLFVLGHVPDGLYIEGDEGLANCLHDRYWLGEEESPISAEPLLMPCAA